MSTTILRKLLVVEDDPEMRAGLRYILDGEFLVTDTSSGAEGLQAAQSDEFPVVILDLHMEGMSGLDALGEFKKINRAQKIIILTGYASQDSAIQALNLGAFRYFLKPIPMAALKAAIKEAFLRFDQEVFAPKPLHSLEQLQWNGLSPREAEVALLVEKGESNREIAGQLRLSIRTVEKHLEAIFAKLKIKRRATLARRIRE